MSVPHRWDGSRWICSRCGAIRPDPCNCPCHVYRILVTGSRNWPQPRKIFAELAALTGVRDRIIVVHGRNRHGADRFAATTSIALGFTQEPYPARWNAYGKQAGKIRNKVMVETGADVCLAFIAACIKPDHGHLPPHGSHGSVHCADLAEKAGIPVRRFLDGWEDPAGSDTQPEPVQQLRLPLPGL